MTVTRHDRCGTMQAGWLCRHAASSTDVSTARPGCSARNTARAGAFPGYPPLAPVRRTAVPIATGTCQESAPCRPSTTVTTCPVDTRTVASLSARVREVPAEGRALAGPDEAGTLAVPPGEALPADPLPPDPPPAPGGVAVPQADSQTALAATSAAPVTSVGIFTVLWTPWRLSRFPWPRTSPSAMPRRSGPADTCCGTVATMPDRRFADQAVMVIGAAGALGAGLVSAFAAEGATVTGVDQSVPTGDRHIGGVSYQAVNVLDDAGLAAVFDEAPAPWAVVNTVGGFAGQTPLSDLDPAVLTGQLELNLVTAALVTKHALRRMAPAGRGRLVHTASRAAVVTRGSGFAYSVSKLGVLHLVTMAADEVRGTGITVNCVVPSIIDTPANRSAMPDADHASWPKIPDIAQAYLFLASPAAHLVSGAAIPV